MVSITRTVNGEASSFAIEDAEEKLRWRGSLPGASIWDRNAHLLRSLQANGIAATDLLSLAMPASWCVNTKASSRAMQRWLAEPAFSAWSELLDVLAFELSVEDWRSVSGNDRARIEENLEKLASGYEGSTLVAITKVLALLRPQLVPLMDDAALWFALELVPEPKTADAPIATSKMFLPMMDWFARQVVTNERALVELATKHTLAVLDAPQTLDRLLWVVSWGK